MKFSIVTPSFRSFKWLKLCVASVADQTGVTLEHIVQDAGSDDGTQEWLAADRRVRPFVEKDSGLYDAVNRGWRRASGDVLAHLNADEQYLPGALAAVAQAFERSPDTDVVLAHTVITDTAGQFVCCRKSMVPSPMLAWTFIPTTTAAIFFRRRLLEEFNLCYDSRWRDLADTMWMRDAIRLRLKMAVVDRYTSVFTDTEANRSFQPMASRERSVAERMKPAWARALRWPLQQLHRLRGLSRGFYRQAPFSYSLYTLASPDHRVDVSVPQPTCVWWKHRE